MLIGSKSTLIKSQHTPAPPIIIEEYSPSRTLRSTSAGPLTIPPQYHGCPSLQLLSTQTIEPPPPTHKTVRLHHNSQIQTQNPPVQTGILTLTGHCALYFFFGQYLVLIMFDVILCFYFKGAIK